MKDVVFERFCIQEKNREKSCYNTIYVVLFNLDLYVCVDHL